MTLAELGGFLLGQDTPTRWRLIAEFLEEFRWEPVETRGRLLTEEPATTGDERWDVFVSPASA
jgi:hypothetical protein